MKSMGQIVAAAWEEAIKRSAPPNFTLYYSSRKRPIRKPSKRQELKWKREDSVRKRKEKREMARFKGRIVRVEGDIYTPVLVYANGRKLKLPEFIWDDE